MARSGAIAAIRQFCLECQGASSRSVRSCPDDQCPLWAWRMAALPGESPVAPEAVEAGDVARAALRAVRRQCMNCAGKRREVRACPARGSCPLWHCRFGVRPQTYKAVRRRFFAPKALRLF